MTTEAHAWSQTFIFLGAPPSKTHPKGLPPVEGWVTCSRCGAQICQQSRGKTARFFLRESARHEWHEIEPPLKVCSARNSPPQSGTNPEGSNG